MPNVGDIEYKYSRSYIWIQPSTQGPGTWRLSNPDELAGGGGGGTGASYDFDGVPPVNIAMTPGTGTNPTVVETSLDFVQLDPRDA